MLNTFAPRTDSVRAALMGPALPLLVVLLAASLGFASVRLTGLLVVAIGAFCTALLATRRPEVVLGIGAFACLGAGQYAVLTRLGQAVLLVGGIAAVFRVLGKRGGPSIGYLALPLLTAGWVGLRLAMGSGVDAARPLLIAIAALALAWACIVDDRHWEQALAWAGLLFVAASLILGSLDETGQRFAGISGNPNRMVMGVLVAIPLFVEQGMRKGQHWWIRAVMLAGVLLSIQLIRTSGSDQGTAGLAIIVLMCGVALSRRVSAVSITVVLAAGIASVALLLLTTAFLSSLSPDVASLSGRTFLYRAGLHEFLSNFLFGSGRIHVSLGTAVDRSTHNSVLGIAASSGVFAVAGWVTFLAVALFRSFQRVRVGYFSGVSAIGVVVSQTVQSVELVALAWIVLLLGSVPFKRTNDHAR